KLRHVSQTEANLLFTLFRKWLRRQFELLCQGDQSDALAMHLLARSQGVATLANAFHDDRFIRAEVQQMHAWLDAVIAEPTSASPSDQSETGKHHVRRSS